MCVLIFFLYDIQGFNQKIVGGEDAFVKDFPWLVLIGSADSADWPVDTTGRVAKYTCGGSLITMSVVLTAAHCLHPKGSDIHYDKQVFHKAYLNHFSPKLIGQFVGKTF